MVLQVMTEPIKQLSFFEEDNIEGDKTLSPSTIPAQNQLIDDYTFGINLLALGQIKGIGVHILRNFIKTFSDLGLVWEADVLEIIEILKKAKSKEPEKIVAEIKKNKDKLIDNAHLTYKNLEKDNVKIISVNSPYFPKRLSEIPSAPNWLFIEGNIDALQSPLIGIVGTRAPSDIGKKAAGRLASIIAHQGLGVISGLADGIDYQAHRWALPLKTPQVAVLGTGIDVYYPANSTLIRKELIKQGSAVITEYLPGSDANRNQFAERNRIQAALCIALCPVESRIDSGTAYTINFAKQYKRHIFGVIYGKPAPENEIISELSNEKYSIFDISRDDDIEDLIDYLKGIVGKSWPAEKPKLDLEGYFKVPLSQLESLINNVSLSNDEQIRLLNRIQKILSTKGLHLGDR